jgi:hypothetical protein
MQSPDNAGGPSGKPADTETEVAKGPECILDVEPPVFPRFVQLERALRWAHGICILEISLGAVNLVTFWATYWWTIVFSVLCFVVGTTGALNFRGVYDLAGTSLCFRTRSLVPVVLYGQLCITVMGVLASITAIIAAANAKKGSVDKAFATFSAVVSALLVIIAVAGTYWIRAVRKWMKPRQRVVYVPYPCPPTQVVADAAPYAERQHLPLRPLENPIAVRSRSRDDYHNDGRVPFAADPHDVLVARHSNAHQGHQRDPVGEPRYVVPHGAARQPYNMPPGELAARLSSRAAPDGRFATDGGGRLENPVAHLHGHHGPPAAPRDEAVDRRLYGQPVSPIPVDGADVPPPHGQPLDKRFANPAPIPTHSR